MNPAPKFSARHRLEVARWAQGALAWCWLVALTMLATGPDHGVLVVLVVLCALLGGLILWLLRLQRRLIHEVRASNEKS
jgi:hypothetical protein